MVSLNRAKQQILKAKHIVITGHINPDGDSVGSMLALALGLKKLKKKVATLSISGVPKHLKDLPGASSIKKNTKENFDLAIAVDCADKRLLGNTFKIFERAKITMSIDHHITRRRYTNINVLDKDATATGEMIYFLLKELGIPIDKNIARNILASLIIETGSFQFPNVKPHIFKICYDLLQTGVDYHKLATSVFWHKSKEATALSGLGLSRIHLEDNGRIACSIISKEDFKKFHGKPEDVDSVAAEMLATLGVKLSIFFREQDKGILRVSLRSNGDINVARIAEKFSGGGHMDAAGCLIENKKAQINKMLKLAKRSLHAK